MSFTYSAGGVMPATLYAWDFNGTTTDYVSGLAPTSIGGNPTYVAGKYIQAINFPNSVNTGTSNPTNNVIYNVSLNATTGFTFAFWVNFNYGDVFAQVILSIAGSNGGRLINVYLDGSNKLRCFDNSADLFFPSFTFSIGTWYHVSLVVANGNRTMYINGQSTTGATILSGTSPNRFILGGDLPSQGNFSAWCSYDDLRVYNTALTAAQVQSIYNQNGVPGRALASSSSYIKSAIGGDIIKTVGGYRIHIFTTVGTSTFTPATSGIVDVLVVAGGGGSGGGQGGAGGGGGVIYTSSFNVSAIPINVTVGNGGAGGIDINTAGSNGGNSIFSSLTAVGGGGGGGDAGSLNGLNGGSGGGSSAENSTIGTPGTGTPGQGNNGGAGTTSGGSFGGGGGGGAGTAGGNGTGSTGGKGGDGLSYSISGSYVYYGGGGGGGVYNGSGTPGTGGLGGGGNGTGSGSGQNGAANTGGGGGGGGTKSNGVLSNGGSGIVIVRYTIPFQLSKRV